MKKNSFIWALLGDSYVKYLKHWKHLKMNIQANFLYLYEILNWQPKNGKLKKFMKYILLHKRFTCVLRIDSVISLSSHSPPAPNMIAKTPAQSKFHLFKFMELIIKKMKRLVFGWNITNLFSQFKISKSYNFEKLIFSMKNIIALTILEKDETQNNYLFLVFPSRSSCFKFHMTSWNFNEFILMNLNFYFSFVLDEW